MSRIRVASLCLALAALVAACGDGAPPPKLDAASRRSPPAGDLVGFVGAYGSHVWRGIPYAQAPVDELRWRAPVREPRWTVEREALTRGPVCPQQASALGGVDTESPGTPVGDEDCLTLDVYAPNLSPGQVPRGDQRMPVMVWIHGGGNVVGSTRLYDGGRLAQEHGVVVVAIHYRLGPLGWFRHASLRAGGGSAEDRSGNFGTLDQLRALAWVQENIEAFGGDPGRVTIFGESAGGRDVFALLLSPLGKGLFHRAIMQSGGTETLPAHRAENFSDDPPPGDTNSSNEVLLRLLQEDGADGRGEARQQLAELSPAEVARYLRAKTPEQLMAAYARDAVEDLPEVPQVFQDGTVLPLGDSLELAARGRVADVPVMIGTNRDEWRLFLLFDERFVEWRLGLLPTFVDEDGFFSLAEHRTDLWQLTGVQQPAEGLRAAGRPVFAYRFDWDEEPVILGLADGSRLVGASHGFEIPFVFGHWFLGSQTETVFSEENLPGREELARSMMSYWAEFAWRGAPGAGRAADLPEWRVWNPGAPDFMVFDTGADGGVRMESGGITLDEIVQGVDQDPRLTSQRDRCETYRELASWGRGFTADHYATAGSEGCAPYPLDDYPWEG